jgi:hypothetical protein
MKAVTTFGAKEYDDRYMGQASFLMAASFIVVPLIGLTGDLQNAIEAFT